MFNDIKDGKVMVDTDGGSMNLGLDQILSFKRDPGDRNRTSPFAFTGNRFEFRAVGSSQSVAGPLVAMNTMLADSLEWIADRLEEVLPEGDITQDQRATAVVTVLQGLMEQHSAVLFGGDGYSEEWHREAVEERGLRNLPTCADALPVLLEDDVVALFNRTGVLRPVELESRFEVYAEQYVLSIGVEAKLMVEMAKTIIYPAAMTYLGELAATASKTQKLGVEFDTSVITSLSESAGALLVAANALQDAVDSYEPGSAGEHMRYCADTIRTLMDDVRTPADALENLVADRLWPLPKYREMLFIR
ncbi:MAG: hypothetical protein R2706_05405 [Acidimicrobiales bacterium]